MTVNLKDVQCAAAAIRGSLLVETPCLPSRTVSQITGALISHRGVMPQLTNNH